VKRSSPNARAVARRAIALNFVTLVAGMTPPAHVLARWRSEWSKSDLKGFYAKFRATHADILESALPWKSAFTAREVKFLMGDLLKADRREHMNMGWRLEALNVLVWALRGRKDLPPYHRQVSPGALRKFVSGDLRAFVAGAKLRANREISKARDLAEFWHWRSRTRQLAQGDRRPFDGKIADFRTFDDIVRSAATSAGKNGDFRPIRQDFPAFGRAYRDITDDQWHTVTSITMERHFTLNWLCGLAPRNRWEDTPTDT
jgi:Domain of unknown function (DUF4272)